MKGLKYAPYLIEHALVEFEHAGGEVHGVALDKVLAVLGHVVQTGR